MRISKYDMVIIGFATVLTIAVFVSTVSTYGISIIVPLIDVTAYGVLVGMLISVHYTQKYYTEYR